MTTPAYGTYGFQSVRTPPADSTQLPAWLSVELANVARAIPQRRTRPLIANYTATSADDDLTCDATAGAFSVTLPLPAQAWGMTITITKTDVSANAITLVATISGAASPTLAAQWNSKTVRSNGVVWYTIASV